MTRRPSVTEPPGRSEPSVPAVDPAGIDYDLAPGLGAVDDIDEITIGIVPRRLTSADEASPQARPKADGHRSNDVA
jgi:hypothetical protein